MTTIADLAGPNKQPACWDPQMMPAFANPALDYNPREHKDLDPLERAIYATAKAKAESEAVDVCFGCPLMLACEQIDIANQQGQDRAAFVVGVIGGRTEAERRARFPRSKKARLTSVANAQIAPGDRGPRGQVDDDLVLSLTKAGKTAEQIARELNCSSRTVSRARARKGVRLRGVDSSDPVTMYALKPTTNNSQAKQTNPTATKASDPHPTKTQKRTKATTKPSSGSAPFSGREIKPMMIAVYNHLTRVGGTAHIDDLIAVAVPVISAEDAANWWKTQNCVPGTKNLRSGKEDVPEHVRVREGARLKVINSVTATARKGRYLQRDGQMYTFKSDDMQAWAKQQNIKVPVTT